MTLNWSGSTDNSGTPAYIVSRGSQEFSKQDPTTFTDGQLTPDTDYHYYVQAVDATGNKSAKIAFPLVHTQPPDSPSPTPSDSPPDTGGPSTPPPPPTPSVDGVTISVSLDTSDSVNCTVTITANVHVIDGDIASGDGVDYSVSENPPGTTPGQTYAAGGNLVTIGTFPVTVDGSASVGIDGQHDSGGWNAPSTCAGSTPDPTDPASSDSTP